MFSRLALLLITLFWGVMNFLLWRSEFGGRNQPGSSVPVGVVWKKVLTAPDNSSLEIFHHGKKIGYCRWTANVGQDLTAGGTGADGPPPEGQVERAGGYQLDFEGNVAGPELPGRLRFDFQAKFAPDQEWREVNLRLNLRPSIWEIHSVAAEQTVRLKMEDAGGKSERVFRFADLRDPAAWLREFELPLALPGFLDFSGAASAGPTAAPFAPGLRWEARNHWVAIGHTAVRAYRLRAPLFDRYQIVVLVSRVGEILRVELPDEVVLINDQVTVL
jgi:hypothetical protein